MSDKSPSEINDAQIARLGDWRGSTLAKLRALIKEADPEVSEVLKWSKPSNPEGVTVWQDHGILCTGEVYKDKVKLTFPKGAAISSTLFNCSLEGNARRALDLYERDSIDENAFKELIRDAVAINRRPKK